MLQRSRISSWLLILSTVTSLRSNACASATYSQDRSTFHPRHCLEWTKKRPQILALGIFSHRYTKFMVLDTHFRGFLLHSDAFISLSSTSYDFTPFITLPNRMFHFNSTAGDIMQGGHLQAAPMETKLGVAYLAILKSTAANNQLFIMPLNHWNGKPVLAKRAFWPHDSLLLASDKEGELMELRGTQLKTVKVSGTHNFRFNRTPAYIRFGANHSIDAGCMFSAKAIVVSNAEQAVYIYRQQRGNSRQRLRLFQKVPYKQFFRCRDDDLSDIAQLLVNNASKFYVFLTGAVMLIIICVVVYVKATDNKSDSEAADSNSFPAFEEYQ